jgi:hypothetical protein
MKSKILTGIAFLLTALVFVTHVHAKTTVYATADDGKTNLFGTLNLETGKFTKIAKIDQLFYALTTGPDGRLYGADLNSGMIFTINSRDVTKPYGNVTAPGYSEVGPPYGFLGLTYQCRQDSLLAVNVGTQYVSLYRIGERGRSLKYIGDIEGPDTGIFFSGNIVFGPRGKLYFNFDPNLADGSPNYSAQLYRVDQFTGAPTPIGSGLGTDALTFLSDGTRLFGIDTDLTSDMGIGIYVIDVKTGVAKRTGTVTGLADGFYLDTATFSPVDDERCD